LDLWRVQLKKVDGAKQHYYMEIVIYKRRFKHVYLFQLNTTISNLHWIYSRV